MEKMTWVEKANWLQSQGYPLAIFALAPGSEDKYVANIEGEGDRYGPSLEDVVSQVYAWVVKKAKE